MKNSHKSKEKMISEKFEKSLNDWKLPPFSARKFFEPRGCCYWFVDCKVNTVDEEIPLKKGSATFTLFSKNRERELQNDCRFVHVVMIQVGLKPTKLGSDTSAIIHLRDKRFKKFDVSVLAKAESSLCDGPIYFSYFPSNCVGVSDLCNSFSIDVEIIGDERITLMYRFCYELKIGSPSVRPFSRRVPVDERGKTTLYVVDIGRGKRVESKTMEWDQIGKNAGEKGGATVDWKETAKGHVLKVDVPGFKKEEVKIEVEDGGVLQISAERSNEEEDEEESEKWHFKERRSGILRRLRLPETADLDEMEACIENGVLTITVPKEEVKPKKPVKIVEISG